MSENEADRRYAQLMEDFEILGSWSLRYQSLIEMGQELPPLDQGFRTPEFFVEGCVSALWIRPEVQEGRLYFQAHSDGVLPKGLVALLVHLFQGLTPGEILAWEGNPVEDLGLRQNLTPTRVQAFGKMLTRFRALAAAAESAVEG